MEKEREEGPKIETMLRKPLDTSYDMAGIQWPYSIPRPTQGTKG